MYYDGSTTTATEHIINCYRLVLNVSERITLRCYAVYFEVHKPSGIAASRRGNGGRIGVQH